MKRAGIAIGLVLGHSALAHAEDRSAQCLRAETLSASKALADLAHAVFLVQLCNDDEAPKWLASANKKLAASAWSEITLTSNALGERITLSGWEQESVTTPSTIWLAPGTYQATFHGDALALETKRQFVVGKATRTVVLVEHQFRKPPSTQPQTVDFGEEQPEIGTPTVVIDNKHKSMVPDRFTRKASQPADDNVMIQDSIFSEKPEDVPIELGLGVGGGVMFDRDTRAAGGVLASVSLTLWFHHKVGGEFRVLAGHVGGETTMDVAKPSMIEIRCFHVVRAAAPNAAASNASLRADR